MTDGYSPTEQDVLRFIVERIESVPHLEALLLIWNNRPKCWSAEDLAGRLYVDQKTALSLMQNLAQQTLIAPAPGPAELYLYERRSDETDALIAAVHAKYKTEVVAVSTMIHRKASVAVRDFADAFRFTKERS